MVGVLVGAQETKVRPAVVIASAAYLAERPDVLVGILTTKLPRAPGSTDYILRDWAETSRCNTGSFVSLSLRYGRDSPAVGRVTP